MKKIVLGIAVLVLLCLGWMGFVREPLPPIPSIRAELSKEVRLDFNVSAVDESGIELESKDKSEGRGMYVQFQMNNAWKTGRPGLVLKGIRTGPGLRNGMSQKEYLEKGDSGKDFSSVLKDKGGNSISTYSFQQTLVEGNDGKTYMKMTYAGPSTEMIQTLDVAQPVTVPAPVSRQFVDKGIIQFQPGVVAFDSGIKGFYIPVVIR